MVKDELHNAPSRKELEERIEALEDQARFTFDVLEMAATLGDFQTSINEFKKPIDILRETMNRVQGIIPFRSIAFLLVNEETSDFELATCEPASQMDALRAEMDHLIDNGVFSMAIRESRPMTVYSMDKQNRIVLHALATRSRIRGMFVGVAGRKERNISSIVLSLLSIIMKSCANAIESFELYRLLRESSTLPKD